MFCLDTNIIIHAVNGHRPDFRARIADARQKRQTVIVPVIVRFELEYGYAKSARPDANRRVLARFLAERMEQPPFDLEDALEAGAIRAALDALGTPIGPYDLLIAAQARRRGAILVTLNRREFDRVPGLMVTDWAT
jgi:tRNA(fMet)-specific endonuclease VapC